MSTLTERRFLSTAEVMKLTGYKHQASFFQMARKSGLPIIRLSSRKFAYDEAQVSDWLARRTTGKAA